jgi:two-component system, LytTR family, sensor kinase
MPFHLNSIPSYTSKDRYILLCTMVPLTFLLNWIMLDGLYFAGPLAFITASLVLFTVLASGFMLYSVIGVLLRNRFPAHEDNTRRLSISIVLFVLLSYLFLTLLLRVYDITGFAGFRYSDVIFAKTFCTMVVVNIFITFLQEGVSRFERYKATITETEKLKKEYMKSQLLGLKSQMNPHFLFNSLNTLSSLIQEEPAAAEKFLDELSKVYRYLLRNNEEYLVSLNEELAFLRAYTFVLRARYGESLQLEAPCTDCSDWQLPPLTLQMLLETMLQQNSLTREQPLRISISRINNLLVVRNSLHSRQGPDTATVTDGLENIMEKFRLIGKQEVRITDSDGERLMELPLLPKEEVLV